jgi:CO/xanthine dehydrogenase Mo-binding subunit
MTDNKYVGNPVMQPVDGLEKVTGRARYVGDMQVADMLIAKVLRSPLPHARIKKLDVSPALQVPGVLAAITCEDFVDHGAFGWPVRDAFILAYQKVRYVGDAIAAVAAESEAAALEGIAAIILELEPLPIIADMHTALDATTSIIPLPGPQSTGNLCNTHVVRNGNPVPIIQKSPLRLDQTYCFAHQEHAYLETEGALAIPEVDGSITIYANDQSPFINRDNAASVLGLDKEKVRVIQPPVGGSFGGKDDIGYQCTAQTARLAQLTGRPVRLILARDESMAASYKREAMDIQLQLGADSDGRLHAAHADLLCDSGAYASMTPLSSWRASMHAVGCYRYDAATVDTRVVYTNNGYSGAFRGFGNTQAAAAIEMAIDELADMCAQDPIAFRKLNCLKTGDSAFTGNPIPHEITIERCLEWVQQKSDWDHKRVEFVRNNKDQTLQRGLGVACYFHGTGLGGEGLDYANAVMRIDRDHTVILQHGLTDYGQGSRTVFTLLAAETLGIEPSRIMMLRPDTQTALETGPTVASRASIVGGNAVRVTAAKIAHMLNMAATDLLSCKLNEIIRQGEKYINPREDEVSLEQVIDHAFEMGFQLSAQGYWQIPRIHWDFESGTGVPYYTYVYGAQVAEVEVNRKNGNVKVSKLWAAHDAGQIIFHNGARGQMLGGIAQGIGYALTEGFTFKDGYPQKLGYDSYTIPSAMDVPEIEMTFIESHLPEGPYGAKNIAEPVMIATAPAILNAIHHATGVRLRELPVNCELLKTA